MQNPLLAATDPWLLELILVRGSYSSGERRAISRDVERGLLLRLLQGVYTERATFDALSVEDRHIVRMRALAAVSGPPPVFSHWSAAVLHGLPVLRERLGRVHVTVEDDDDRHRLGATAHRFLLDGAGVARFGQLLATGVGRTVVDIAGAAPFEEGVMAADAALRANLPRSVLASAVDLAGPRRAGRRIREAVGFAHPGAESAGESRSRVTMARIGVEVPELQHRVLLRSGSEAFLDFFFRSVRVGGEFDGDQKFLDAAMAPKGAAQAVIGEKRREDELRLDLSGLARFGWVQAGNVAVLRGILARVGVVPPRRHVTMADYIAAARDAQPRFRGRR